MGGGVPRCLWWVMAYLEELVEEYEARKWFISICQLLDPAGSPQRELERFPGFECISKPFILRLILFLEYLRRAIREGIHGRSLLMTLLSS